MTDELTAASLHRVAATMPVPTYDRAAVTPGIVHIGVGGFHRAHQAMYVDRLLSDGAAMDWGIHGVGLLPSDRRMRDVMRAQDCLYTVVVKHPDRTLEPRVIGSIVRYAYAPDDPDAVIEAMAAESTRIVSLTVTEGGYSIHPVTGEFDARSREVADDLTAGARPATVFGYVTEALDRRRKRGLGPFTVMSCDNVQGNGDVARRAFTRFAALRDEDLGRWIEEEGRFPNSMVDRITPVTKDIDRALVAERFGVHDAWPVVCEPYTQWVLEDAFCDGRPPLEDAGVQVVDDVEPYELMKLRLLNGSHQALCYLGYLAGYRYAHEVCRDPLFVRFLRGYMDCEATPTLEPVPGVDLAAYKRTLIERFANPEVADSLARLCAESSDRIPKWLVPVITQQLATGGDVRRSALVIASWARYAEGVDEHGAAIEVVDRLRDEVMAAAQRQADDPTAFIANRTLFADLVDDAHFVGLYQRYLRSLHERGARATVADVVTG